MTAGPQCRYGQKAGGPGGDYITRRRVELRLRASLRLLSLLPGFMVAAASVFGGFGSAAFAQQPAKEEPGPQTADDYLKFAARLIELKRYDHAVRMYQELMAKFPQDARMARIKLDYGYALVAAGRLYEATRAFRKVAEAYPDAPEAREARLGIARSLEARGEFLQAIVEYKEYINRFPDASLQTRLYITSIYGDILGKAAEAATEYEDLIKQNPAASSNAELLYRIAELYQYRLANIAKARDVYAELVQRYPESPLAKRAQELVAKLSGEGLGQYPRAIFEYSRFIQNYPNDPTLKEKWLEIARIYREHLRQHYSAAEAYGEAYRLEPSEALLWYRIQCLAEARQWAELAKSYEQFLANYKDSPRAKEARRGLCMALWQVADRREEAMRRLEELLGQSPDDELRWEAANRYLQEKRYDDAAKIIAEFVQKRPEWRDGEGIVALARVYLGKGAKADAEKLLRESAAKYADAIAARLYWTLATEVLEGPAALDAFRKIYTDYPDVGDWAERTKELLGLFKTPEEAEAFYADVAGTRRYHPRVRLLGAELVGFMNEKDAWPRANALAGRLLADGRHDYAGALTLVYQTRSLAKLGQTEELLYAFLDLEDIRTDARFAGLHAKIDDARRDYLSPTLQSLTVQTIELADWRLKLDPENQGEALKWSVVGHDETWKPVKTGTDWGDYKGVGWYDTEVPAAKSQGLYRLRFAGVGGTVTVYADGKVVGEHRGGGSFTVPFSSERLEGNILLVLKIKSEEGPGGLLKGVSIEVPASPTGRKLLWAGLAHHGFGSYDHALDFYTRYLESLPKNAPADATDPVKELEDRIYYRQKNFEGLRLNKPSRPSARYLLLMAQSYLEEEKPDFEASLRVCKAAFEAYPNDISVCLALAAAHERMQQWQEAVNVYQKVISDHPDRPEAEELKSHIVRLCAERWRNLDLARTLALQCYNDKKTASWARLLGDLYFLYDPKNPPAALRAYTEYYRMKGADRWYAGSRIVEIQRTLKRFAEAQEYAEQWVKENPDHPNVVEMLFTEAEVLREKKADDQALTLYRRVIAEYPTSEAAFRAVSVGITELEPGARDLLLADWVAKNKGSTRVAELYWQLAQSYEKKAGGQAEAIKLYTRIAQEFPDKYPENVYALSRTADIYASQNLHSKAIPLYETIVKRFAGQGLRQVIDAWFALISYYGPELKIVATTDSSYAGFSPVPLTDGVLDGMDGSSRYCWMSLNELKEHWVECTWEEPENVSKVEIYWGNSRNLPKAYRVRYWDGKQFADVPATPDWTEARTVYCPHTFPPIKTNRIRFVMKENGGGNLRPNIMEVAEVKVFRHMDTEAEQRLRSHCEQMVRTFKGRGEAFQARVALAGYYATAGKFLDAQITLQKAIYESPANDPWYWDRGMEQADAKMRAGRYSEAAGLYRSLLHVHPDIDKQKAQDAEKYFGDALAKAGAGVAPIDPNAPEAGLLWGNMYALSGDEELAFKKYEENEKLFPTYEHQLAPEYIQLIVRGLLRLGEVQKATDTCRRFIIRRSKDPHVPDDVKAQMQLLMGDCYYKAERYDLAHDEYRSAITYYPQTQEAIEARFRIGQTLIAQRVYGTAEQVFRDLAKSRDTNISLRARFMLGVVYHYRGDKEQAIQQFKEVLALQPVSETADSIMFRLGVLYSEERRYKEALDILRLIGAYRGDAQQLLEPGTEFRIRLSDKHLMVTRGSADVPIIVTTTAGDRETIYLSKSEAGPGLFIGSIATTLGDAVVGDKKLQVIGTDTISYDYAPYFKKDFGVKEGTEALRTVRIAADAKLYAASTKIKDEEEVDASTLAQTKPKRKAFRNETQIKPGNFIYVRVVDADRDISSKPDKVKVAVESSSGDTVEAELEETAPHSGKFDGKIKTGPKPPDATASDCSEGHDARFAIDGSRDPEQCWMGAKDRKVPKWLTVDLKDLFTITRIEWHRGDGAKDRAPVRYRILYSQDNKTWDVLASVPEAWNYHDKLDYAALKVRFMPNMLGDPKTLDEAMMMCELAPMIYGERNVEWINDEAGNPFGPSEYYIAVYWGNFYAPETGTYGFATDSDDASFLLVDGKLIAEYPGNHAAAGNWSHKGEIFLQKGVHTITYYFQEWEIINVARAAWRLPSGADFEIIPKEFFDPKVYPDLLKSPKKELERYAKVETDPDGMGAVIKAAKPIKARYVQMLIKEYQGDAPAVAYFAIYGEQDKKLVPSGTNVHEIATNDTLEITPGDVLTVSYNDERNVSSGVPKMLRKMLSATYYNGSIRVIKRDWRQDDAGNRYPVVRYVSRIQVPTRIIVEVEDYDEDTTDETDSIPIVARTSTGRTITLTAQETEPYSGVFTKELDLTPDERPGTLQMNEGEWLEVAYEDKENTDPGNRIERKMRIAAVVSADARIRIVGLGEKEGLLPGPDEADAIKLLHLEKPIVVEVYDTDQAFDSGSTVTVSLSTTSGAKQKLVCRVPGVTEMGAGDKIDDVLACVARGYFRGAMKLRLGDETSPNTIASGDAADQESEGKPANEIPVLNLSGKDIVSAEYVDLFTAGNKGEARRYAKARLVSDGMVQVTDDRYENEVASVHISDRIYIRAEDLDQDVSKEQDTIKVTVESSVGDKVVALLRETLPHSGVFTGSVAMRQANAPDLNNDLLEADYGSTFTVTYVDRYSTESREPVDRQVKCEVIVGTDGQLVAFSRTFGSKQIEVDTLYKVAECYYEMGKGHLKLKQKQLGISEIKQAETVLQEMLITHPDNPISDQAAFLLARLAMERGDFDEAIRGYRTLIAQYPNSSTAPQAQYDLAICYQKKNDFERACEEFVKLFYRYPNCSQIPEARIRLGTYFFDKKDYLTSLNIFKKFVEAHPDHPSADKVAFRIGICYIQAERFSEAGDHFRQFVDKYENPDLKASALYWGGDAYLKAGNLKKSYQMLKRCVWDYPTTDWAKFARSRLTDPRFDNIKDDQ